MLMQRFESGPTACEKFFLTTLPRFFIKTRQKEMTQVVEKIAPSEEYLSFHI